jgi:hypothetical protein
MGHGSTLVCVLVLLVAAGCASPLNTERGDSVLPDVRRQLSEEAPDSDAALILSQALKEVESVPPEKQSEILATALKQADKARRFSPTLEALLPERWPKPSLPGLIRVKSYPQARAAWVQGSAGNNRQFMTLFRHIQDRHIAMTAPVVMGYPAEVGRDPAAAKAPNSMAFLYRSTTQDAAGQFGPVLVGDESAVQVVSVGLKGSYAERNFQAAIVDLQGWLKTHQEWEASGPPRVLAYNSPFLPFWMKYSEVQIPVRAAASPARQAPVSGQRP